MGQITINGVVKTVDDDVQKYIEDCERDTKNALAAAESAAATIKSLELKVDQAVVTGSMKVKAAESKLIGWVEARAHSFFLAVDGNFNRVTDFLRHVAAGLEPHAQPKTIGGAAPAVTPPAAPRTGSSRSTEPSSSRAGGTGQPRGSCSCGTFGAGPGGAAVRRRSQDLKMPGCRQRPGCPTRGGEG